jgi:hypothetical protein
MQLNSMTAKRLISDPSSRTVLMQGDDARTWEDEAAEIPSCQQPFSLLPRQNSLKTVKKRGWKIAESSDNIILYGKYRSPIDSNEDSYLSCDSSSTSSSVNSSHYRRAKILSVRHQLSLRGIQFSRFSGNAGVYCTEFSMQNSDSEYV